MKKCSNRLLSRLLCSKLFCKMDCLIFGSWIVRLLSASRMCRSTRLLCPQSKLLGCASWRCKGSVVLELCTCWSIYKLESRI